MPPPRDNPSSNDGSDASRSSRNPPLVIVSERGRHSEASRRIVRAQAARASAAQSRETRARNREDRHQSHSTVQAISPAERNGQQPITAQFPHNATPNTRAQSVQYPFRNQADPGGSQEHDQPQNQAQTQYRPFIEGQGQSQGQSQSQGENPLKPLVNWITNVLRLPTNSFAAGAAILAGTGRPQLGNAHDVLTAAGGILADSGAAMEQVQITGGVFNRRLPIALPKGFANLQQRIQISDAFLVLLSRTACFDFASPGVEDRLHKLLFDIVMTSATATIANADQYGHPIQSHLRIACACLTIFQGQRADGRAFAQDQKYMVGLQAAWAEATVLDQDALREPKSAEAALWAIFIISVTCGSTETFFQKLLWSLCQDLQLHYWEQVRTVLLEFIYPGSFLDGPCRQFFDHLQGHGQPGQPGALQVN